MSESFDYIWYQNVLSKKEIKKINTYIDKSFDFYESTDRAARDSQNRIIKKARVKCIYWNKIYPLIQRPMEQAFYTLTHNFGYDIHTPTGVDVVNLNIYNAEDKSHYGWHIDASDAGAPYDFKGTILLNVSMKPYEGGQFKVSNQEEYHVPQYDKPGSLLVVKSFLNHKVEPVTKGERRSLAFLASGPKFK